MALAVLASNGVTASDVIYLNLPLYHTAGFLVGFVGAVETGERLLPRSRSPRRKQEEGEMVLTEVEPRSR